MNSEKDLTADLLDKDFKRKKLNTFKEMKMWAKLKNVIYEERDRKPKQKPKERKDSRDENTVTEINTPTKGIQGSELKNRTTGMISSAEQKKGRLEETEGTPGPWGSRKPTAALRAGAWEGDGGTKERVFGETVAESSSV